MEAVLAKTRKLVNAVAHLGDGWGEIHELMLKYPGLPLYAVSGNCDSGPGPSGLDFMFAGKKIVMTHGHRFHVKSGYLRVSLWAEEGGADICLFGHSHAPELFYSGRTLMMNPGSVALPRGGRRASYGIVDVSEKGLIEGRVMEERGGGYAIAMSL